MTDMKGKAINLKDNHIKLLLFTNVIAIFPLYSCEFSILSDKNNFPMKNHHNQKIFVAVVVLWQFVYWELHRQNAASSLQDDFVA